MSLRPLCPTPFTVRYQSLLSLEKNFVIVPLEEILQTCSDESGAKASGLLKRLLTLRYVVWLACCNTGIWSY